VAAGSDDPILRRFIRGSYADNGSPFSSSITTLPINAPGGAYAFGDISATALSIYVGDTSRIFVNDQRAYLGPPLTGRDDGGTYVETGISVLNGGYIQITAQPFDGKLQQHIASGHRSRPYPYRFYNPNPLTLTSTWVCNSYKDYINNWDFQCSDDGNTWTALTSGNNINHSSYGQWTFFVPNSGAHRYYEFRVVSGTDGDWQNLSELTIYGTQTVVDDPETTVIPEVQHEKLYLITKERNAEAALTADFHRYARQASTFRTVKWLSIGAIGILAILALLRRVL
jgi:hypothetical protein